MPLFARKCLCKPLGKCFFCFIWRKKSGTERERICVVVFASRSEHAQLLAAHIGLLATWFPIVECAAHALKAICDDSFSLAGGAYHDGTAIKSLCRIRGKFLGCTCDYFRIIIPWVVHERSTILHFVTELITHKCKESIFEFKSSVISSEINFHVQSLFATRGRAQ
jgi:hypothetical protein